LAVVERQRDDPVVGARDIDIQVEPVVPLLALAQGRRAATARVTGVTGVTGVARVTTGGVHRDVGASAALVALGSHDHVVVAAQVHTDAGPRVEVVADGDGPARPPRLPDAPVLVEGPGALDGGGVVPRRLVDVVGATVRSDRAHVRTRGPVGAPVLHDVVLDERVPRPSVEGQVGVTGRVEAARVGHGPAPTGVPAFTGDEVPGVPPAGAVIAAGPQGHGDRAGSVGPERIEVPAVVTGLVAVDGVGV